MALLAVSAHPRLCAPPTSPFVMLPAEEMRSQVSVPLFGRRDVADSNCCFVLLSDTLVRARAQGWTAPLDNSGRLLLCRAAGNWRRRAAHALCLWSRQERANRCAHPIAMLSTAALVCVAHVATWSAFQQHGFVADGIHEVLCRLAHCVTTLHMNPKEGFFAEVWN